MIIPKMLRIKVFRNVRSMDGMTRRAHEAQKVEMPFKIATMTRFKMPCHRRLRRRLPSLLVFVLRIHDIE